MPDICWLLSCVHCLLASFSENYFLARVAWSEAFVTSYLVCSDIKPHCKTLLYGTTVDDQYHFALPYVKGYRQFQIPGHFSLDIILGTVG